MALLDDDDLAYVRETQAEVRPTEVNYYAHTPGASDGRGGRTNGTWAAAEPLAVRITQVQDSATSDDVPTALAARYDVADLVRVTSDLVSLKPGDYLHDQARDRWYAIVTHGLPQDWTTALQVWATLADGDPRG